MADGKLIGDEVKCLNTVKSAYSKGGKGSHVDNGDLYSFGSTQEAIYRDIIGAKPQGKPGDAYFDHSKGGGRIPGVDWPESQKPGAKPKPAYRDALTRGQDLRVLLHEVWGGFGGDAEQELDSLKQTATRLGDATDYAGSNARDSFKAHWARKIGITLLTSIGDLFNARARQMGTGEYASVARAQQQSGWEATRGPAAAGAAKAGAEAPRAREALAWERAQRQQARSAATFEVDGSVPRLKAERARSRKRVLQEAGLCVRGAAAVRVRARERVRVVGHGLSGVSGRGPSRLGPAGARVDG